MNNFKHNSLFKQQAYINESWETGSGGEILPVINPANFQQLGTVPDLIDADIAYTIEHAQTAFLSWRKVTAKEVFIHTEELAEILTAEHGSHWLKQELKLWLQ